MAGSLKNVRGAIYFPSRSLNHYQTWNNYDRGEIHRDLVSAQKLDINALRVLLSYEFWRDNPEAFRQRFDHFLAIANTLGINVLPVFFESIGAQPTKENLTNKNLLESFAVQSPHGKVVRNRNRWDGPRRFVRWFTRRYGRHDKLLALEIMNEPGGWQPRVDFCQAMLRAARDEDSSVPLTMGTKEFKYNLQYKDPSLDVFQFHFNLPPTVQDMREKLSAATRFANQFDTPIWLTEWQRTRENPPNKYLPNYSSLASVVRNSDIDGDFFWQLMLKPAYIETPRKQGRLNGLVHRDGTVYSTEDARAIAKSATFENERPKWPSWANTVQKQFGQK